MKAEHLAGKDTVQATNEAFEGDIDLYDYIVRQHRAVMTRQLTQQYTASVNVTNTGKTDGAAVPQLVSLPG